MGSDKSMWTGILSLLGHSRLGSRTPTGGGTRPARVPLASFVPSVADRAMMSDATAHTIRMFAITHLDFFKDCKPAEVNRWLPHNFTN